MGGEPLSGDGHDGLFFHMPDFVRARVSDEIKDAVCVDCIDKADMGSFLIHCCQGNNGVFVKTLGHDLFCILIPLGHKKPPFPGLKINSRRNFYHCIICYILHASVLSY